MSPDLPELVDPGVADREGPDAPVEVPVPRPCASALDG